MNLIDLTLSEAALALKRGEVTAEAYADALLARCDALEDLSAFITLNADKVREHARAADRRRAQGATLGPLHGIPIVVKDNIDVAGYPTTAGTPALRNHRPQRTAPVVQALLDAGAIVLGKTNMHELAYGLTSNNAAFGPVRNPYDRTRSPGGSSGGTAAAIAARMSPGGLASDTAGSIRIPAALCGIVGFRPSMGRYSQTGLVPMSHSRDTAGPMARTVADIVLLDQVITGDQAPDPANLKGLRLGVPRRHYYDRLDPQLEAVVEQALASLRDLGVVLVEADLSGVKWAFGKIARPITDWEFPRDLAAYLKESGSGLTVDQIVDEIVSPDVKPQVAAMLEPDAASEAAYRDAVERRMPALRAAFADYFKTHDIVAIVFPTTPLPAPLLGQDQTVEHLGGRISIWTYLRNTVLASLTGGPGLSLPIGLTKDSLPVSLELDASEGHDAALLSIALAWQRATNLSTPPYL
jgi:mandelamide amidase